MRPLPAVCLGLLLLTAACGAPSGDDDATPAPGAPTTDAPTPSRVDPLALVGLWSLDDVEPGAALRLDVASLTIIRDCGVVSGDWRADDAGLFVASTFAGSAACAGPGGSGLQVPWLHDVVGFRRRGETLLLVDAHGEPVVALEPAEATEPPPDVAPELVTPPTITAETRAALRPSAPLPAALTRTRRAGLDGDELVRLDVDANELGRLRRSGG